jgi:hypothetical protein
MFEIDKTSEKVGSSMWYFGTESSSFDINASIPKVVGSIPTVARQIFQAWPVWIYTQSNITNIIFYLSTPTQKKYTTCLSGFWAQ